jgi:hypothetical protein
VSPEPSDGDARPDEPLPGPIPGTEFKRLNRRQSIVAWAGGSLIGTAAAIAALLVFAPPPL